MKDILIRAATIVPYILLPLAWGLAVEFFFELLRRRRADLRPDEDVE